MVTVWNVSNTFFSTTQIPTSLIVFLSYLQLQLGHHVITADTFSKAMYATGTDNLSIFVAESKEIMNI